ncbi:MAG: hypothetical protein GX352_10180 [Clostridiales bacterium]|nr:hypothetical protein [Clostridiales bacterium]
MPSDNVDKYDVLILSADFGKGHHQVSAALQKVLSEERPHWDVAIHNYFKQTFPLLNGLFIFFYCQLIRWFPFIYDWYYRITDSKNPLSVWHRILSKIGSKKMLQLITHCSPRIIICTFPTPAGVISRLKEIGKIDISLAVVVTDVTSHSQWIHKTADRYFLAANAPVASFLEKGVLEEKIQITGIPIRPQFESPIPNPGFWLKHNLDPSIFTLLIMGGGRGMMPGVDKICKRLAAMTLPMQIIALTGSNKALAMKLKVIVRDSSIPIRVIDYVENIAPVMKGAHLLLSKAGGITVFEALAVKLPLLIYKPLPGHEMCNVRFLLENNAALKADNVSQAVKLIKKAVKDPALLRNISRAMGLLSRPSSAREVVKTIIDMVGNNNCGNPAETDSQTRKNLYA